MRLSYCFWGVGLAMDAFAVSLAAGAHPRTTGFRPAFRLWFHFGLFQCLMTILGWFLGMGLEKVIVAWDHWLAFVLLGVVGGKMIKEGLEAEESAPRDGLNDPSRGVSLLSLSIATSIDAMAVGISLGVLRVTVWEPSAIIGLVTALLSLVGLRIGRFFGRKLGRRMEVVGGIGLLAIALKIVITG